MFLPLIKLDSRLGPNFISILAFPNVDPILTLLIIAKFEIFLRHY
jgi:hypothetical protein